MEELAISAFRTTKYVATWMFALCNGMPAGIFETLMFAAWTKLEYRSWGASVTTCLCMTSSACMCELGRKQHRIVCDPFFAPLETSNKTDRIFALSFRCLRNKSKQLLLSSVCSTKCSILRTPGTKFCLQGYGYIPDFEVE